MLVVIGSYLLWSLEQCHNAMLAVIGSHTVVQSSRFKVGQDRPLVFLGLPSSWAMATHPLTTILPSYSSVVYHPLITSRLAPCLSIPVTPKSFFVFPPDCHQTFVWYDSVLWHIYAFWSIEQCHNSQCNVGCDWMPSVVILRAMSQLTM